jgi:antibiotic biosynthesis monooxygenase (ABM) superfamily enzyme
VSSKGKFWVFVASLALFLYVFVMYNLVGNGDGLPWSERYLIGSIGIVFLLTYFILSYWALMQENLKRRGLYESLGEEKWQRLNFCTVRDVVVCK